MEVRRRKIQFLRSRGGRIPAIDWLNTFTDVRTKAKLTARIERLGEGNFGDFKNVGDGVFELRVHYGPGFRVYFGFHQNQVVIIIYGGDKNTQTKDIKKAKTLWREFENGVN